MSVYYAFACETCKQRGGLLSVQAWGWGNFDIVDSFKFLVQHIGTCGTAGLRVASESDVRYDYPEQDSRALALATPDVFPRSNDWDWITAAQGSLAAAWLAHATRDTDVVS